jgi:transposase-like protein
MPKKAKISTEEKISAVESYLHGGLSQRQAAQKAGVKTAPFQRWLRIYRAEGPEGLRPHTTAQKYSPDQKLEAVKAYLSGEGSIGEVCAKRGIRSDSQFGEWIKEYNAHGDFNSKKKSGGGSCMKQGRETTLEERVQIAKECISSGKKYGEMAQKYQVSYQQVRAWTLRFEELGEAGLQDRRGRRKKDQTPRTKLEEAQIEIERLKHKLYLAEMERDLLKKLDEVERRDVSQK